MGFGLNESYNVDGTTFDSWGSSTMSSPVTTVSAPAPIAAESNPWYDSLLKGASNALGTIISGQADKITYGDDYASRKAGLEQYLAFSRVNGSGPNNPLLAFGQSPISMLDFLSGNRQASTAPQASSSMTMYALIGGAVLLLVVLMRR